MASPKTATEAINLGHRELFGDEKDQGLKMYGPTVAVVDCTTVPPGTLCAQTKCVNGYQISVYCDGSGGCTRYFRTRC